MSTYGSHRVAGLLVLGLIFHLTFISTVFDCYFTSPVVHGMQPHNVGVAGSKRLVLIVGDGLRADLLLHPNGFPMTHGSPDIVAPYIRSIIQTRGAFGISHTRVPTESRPGHVALIGGMYEDVSAVTKGWKTNPVEFDSVFNRSSHTFSFGSPDILPMFSRGAVPGRVDIWCYDEEAEDFTKDATALDVWVLDQLRTLFHNATSNSILDAQLHAEKTVFFLHLLGLDTTGHSYRPQSKEYMTNIQVVDEIVHQTETLFNEFYKDSDTSFVFTADHGMSKIGNHGDGDPDNTRTPLVVWGKGVRGPLPDSVPSSHDEYSAPWGLSHVLRHDVEQADVATLMAALVGIDWPVNSVGVLPDVNPTLPGYLAFEDERTQAHAAEVNAKVILEHYRVKHYDKKTHTLLYKPYKYLAHSGDIPGAVQLAEISNLIHLRNFTAARESSADLIKHTLEGLRYLQTYDQALIRTIVAAAYLGWIAFSAVSILLPHTVFYPKFYPSGAAYYDILAVSVLFSTYAIFTVQRSPWTFYVYVVFPCYFWHQVGVRASAPLLRIMRTRGLDMCTLLRMVLGTGGVVLALRLMVSAYTTRSIWSLGLIGMGIAWPVLGWPGELRAKHWQLFSLWAFTCCGTALFPLLSVDKQESLSAILIGGVTFLSIGLACAGNVYVKLGEIRQRYVWLFQCILICLSMLITASSITSLQAKQGLPVINQVFGWIVLLIAPLAPFAVPVAHSVPETKILTLFLGFGVCFIVLSISVEGLFYCFYSATLFVWIEVEALLRAHQRRVSTTAEKTAVSREGQTVISYQPRADDLRIAVFFLLFVQVAFFGTGNVASIASFYLEPVYRLVPIFNPFLMAALLIFKIIAPYIILAACFATLTARLELPPFSLFLVALSLTDVMTITFFFNVTDTGSWLEIGQSISFFCISSLLLVWSGGICAIGEALMAGTVKSNGQAQPIDKKTQ